ncbi:MAG: FAD-binding oxidoreductase [Porticoccaceae bacterium]|jgi:FAD/FMN-containing dehydrogenase|nr:FAD-binding oxidoreductase [Porticoccaceae bacterium]MBT6320415.1 FAD-binding oxidoreductase [Porticoccaceae bacterium]MBT7257502.1 FAD-binding oxidoreductase [Porticoccaceae bacterium]MBT7904731.1 FAD-binding oxidoreductase [Porticoccaceae bacterium]MDA9574335.1 FAD-binding oxidoreductase [Porticoccaceae bacterium]
MQTLIEQLTQILEPSALFLGDDISEKYHADWSGASACAPAALLKPKTTEQLSQIMALCYEQNQPVVVQGGLTGLAGGATPLSGEFAISLERMNAVEEIDARGMTATVLAGTPLQVLQEAAEEHDLFMPLDLGARGSCNIGGNVATNAGGTEVIRYGMTRSLVLGLEVVLADGTVINAMNKMVKNNSGYDLKHLFIGSEGTLGIVTRVVVQLQPKPLACHTALCALEDYDSVTKLLTELKRSLGSGLTGFELMWDNYYNKVLEVDSDLQNPFGEEHHFYLLVEYKDNETALGAERFEAELFGHLEAELLSDAVVAQSHQDAEEFWRIRDGIGELLKALGPVSNQDVSLPIADIGVFSTHLETRLKAKYPDIGVLLFGHIGDNNLHVCAYTGREEDKLLITEDIMSMIGEYSGAITAEHGVGVLKRDYLELSRTPEEIALMKTIKTAMDPKGILNPGRVI